MKPVLPTATMLVLFPTTQVISQMSTSSELPYHNSAAVQDPTDYGVRDQNAKMGRTIEDWARHLDDPDPVKRLEAVRLLATSGKPQANEFLIRAVDNRDPRVATFAVDSLGKLGIGEASEVLVERLSTQGTSTTRQHILVALGKIRDPKTAKRVLDFAQVERDPDVRAVAIRVLGEIGDDSVRSGIEKLSESETDPRLKALMQEVVGKMTVPKGPAQGEVKSSATFSHSEPPR
jgi:HEAT repeat protein